MCIVTGLLKKSLLQYIATILFKMCSFHDLATIFFRSLCSEKLRYGSYSLVRCTWDKTAARTYLLNALGRTVGILTIAMVTSSILDSRAQASQTGFSVGLNGISDWSTQHPFLDIMKSARPWIGHKPEQWGGLTIAEMETMGILDEMGWPLTVPEGVTSLETLILTDQPTSATHLAGRYHLFYEGQGSFKLTGRAKTTNRSDGHLVFDYTPGDGFVGLQISSTDTSDPLRNIRVIKDEHLELYSAGVVFNPLWISKLKGFDTIRFMGWTDTNNSSIATWQDMPRSTDFSFAWRGVPVDLMIQLANDLNADPWFNIAHLSDDDLVTNFASQVFATLEPHLVAHVEYSNEMWNFIFDQALWALQQAEERWGELGDGWMQFYGVRAAEVMNVWTDVYGDAAQQRLKRVIAVQTSWPGLEQSSLFGNKAREALGYTPIESFDAYAVTGYFGYELSDPATIEDLLTSADKHTRAAGEAKGLSRVALREYVKENWLEGTFEPAADMVRTGSLSELANDLWPYHASVAENAGLELLMYEGGSHAAASWDAVNDQRFIEFLNKFNYSEAMGGLYTEAFQLWDALGGFSFNIFVDVAPPSKWGSWGALRHLNDDNPRWRAIQENSSMLKP